MDFLKRTWAEVDLDCISHNYAQIRRHLGNDTTVMAVVKADAYGHGDRLVAAQLQEDGVKWFGVSNLEEALSLRRSGITGDILVLGCTPESEAALLVKHGVTQTVYSLEYAAALSAKALEHGVTVHAHIKADTGMTRLGFDGWDTAAAAREIAIAAKMPGLACSGIFTHLACADEDTQDSAGYTRAQFARFTGLLDALEARGIFFELRHCCNSAGAICYPEMKLDMVRCGIELYGLYPSPDCAGLDIIGLKPAMSLLSSVSQVRQVPSERPVSYGRTHTVPAGNSVAVVPIGYADGYSRSYSNRARMIVNGSFAPLIGRVCMDQVMLDVTGMDVRRGDIVTVFGSRDGCVLPVEELAAMNGTINYELVCLVGRRVPRVYYKDGKQYAVTDYIIG